MSQCPGIMIWLNPAPVLVHTPSDLNNIDAHALLMVLRTFFVRQCQDSFPKGLLNRKVCAPVPRCGLKCCSLKWKTCVCVCVCRCVCVSRALFPSFYRILASIERSSDPVIWGRWYCNRNGWMAERKHDHSRPILRVLRGREREESKESWFAVELRQPERIHCIGIGRSFEP